MSLLDPVIAWMYVYLEEHDVTIGTDGSACIADLIETITNSYYEAA